MRTLKSLPIGISDYVRAQSEYYYVDKTMLIKEFLDKKPLVSLFTRPRRFGKTLNMDMLRVFFEKKAEDTSKFFTDKDIWKCGEEYSFSPIFSFAAASTASDVSSAVVISPEVVSSAVVFTSVSAACPAFTFAVWISVLFFAHPPSTICIPSSAAHMGTIFLLIFFIPY